jgi:hypothetical protein
MFDRTAIIFGVIATVFIHLIAQLIFILTAAYIGNADGNLSFLATYKHELWFALGLLTQCITMFIGGAIVAFAAKSHVVVNAALVGALATCVSMAMSVGEDQFTFMSIMMVVIGAGCAALGSLAWDRYTASSPA